VVAGAFLILAITCGAFLSFGVFFVPVMTEFGWTRGMTSGVRFVMGITYGITAPLIGQLADRYGFRRITVLTIIIIGLGFSLGSQIQNIWHLYLFIGLLPGLGACATLALPFSLVSLWFTKRQGLALGLVSSGIGVGTIFIPLLVAHFIAEFDWRNAFAIVGLIIWLTCLPISIFTMRNPDSACVKSHEGREPLPTNSTIQEGGNQQFTLSEAVLKSPFWFLFFIFAVFILCMSLTITHLVPYALDTDLSAITAASLFSIFGLFSIIGRITSGVVSDRIGTGLVLFICLTIQGMMMIWLMQANAPWMFYLFSALFGASCGGNLVEIPKLTASIFGAKSMGTIFGGLSAADGLGIAIGPLFAGYIFDVTGSYDLSFLIASAGLFAAVFLTWMLKKNSLLKHSAKMTTIS